MLFLVHIKFLVFPGNMLAANKLHGKSERLQKSCQIVQMNMVMLPWKIF